MNDVEAVFKLIGSITLTLYIIVDENSMGRAKS